MGEALKGRAACGELQTFMSSVRLMKLMNQALFQRFVSVPATRWIRLICLHLPPAHGTSLRHSTAGRTSSGPVRR
jgi:hypothetical protein